jgi:hypothetical protein
MTTKLQCPVCDYADGFQIAATSFFDVYDQGEDVEQTGDIIWTESSICQCKACKYLDIVRSFTREETESD